MTESLQSVGRARESVNKQDRFLFRTRDFGEVARLIGLLPFAWILPDRAWHPVAAAAGTLLARLRRERTLQMAGNMGSIIGGRCPGVSVQDVARRRVIMAYFDRLQILRCWRPGGWTPRVRLHGEEHLEEALDTGNGAILWVADFVFAPTLVKLALHRAGYQISHLSHRRHGFSQTHLGRRLLNPIRTRIEDRYLRERISITMGTIPAAMRQLHRRLGEGGVVSVTTTRWGRRTVTVPFLDGYIELANGAPALALETGAALLPVFALRAADASFDVTVGPAISVDRPGPRQAVVAACAQEFAHAVEPFVLADLAQWKGWELLCLPPEDTVAPAAETPTS